MKAGEVVSNFWLQINIYTALSFKFQFINP